MTCSGVPSGMFWGRFGPQRVLFAHPPYVLPGCAPILGLTFSIGPSESLWSTPAWHIYIFFPNSHQFRSHCQLLGHLLGPLCSLSSLTMFAGTKNPFFLSLRFQTEKQYSDPGFIIYQLHHLGDLTSPIPFLSPKGEPVL